MDFTNAVSGGVQSKVLQKKLMGPYFFQSQCRDDEFEHEGQVFSLDYRAVSGDVSLPENAFRTQDFLPHGKTNYDLQMILFNNSWVDLCKDGSLGPFLHNANSCFHKPLAFLSVLSLLCC